MSRKQRLWYQYSRALLVGFAIAFVITLLTAIIHFAVYSFCANEFRMFFGVEVGELVWWKYLIYFILWATVFILIFRNEWELL